MKYLLSFICLLAVRPLMLQAQSADDSALRRQSMLFDHFTDGAVLLKSHELSRAPLNYSGADQSILFMKDGKMYTLTALGEVDTIYINERKFVPLRDKVYEVVSTSGKIRLYISYTTKMRPLTATASHSGSTTRENAAEVNNTVSNVYVSRSFRGDFEVEITRHYWLVDYNNLYRANNLKDFLKVFKESTHPAIETYMQGNPVDFKSEADLAALVNFCNRQ